MSTQMTLANEQKALWNGDAGAAWVQSQDLLDRLLQPLEDLLVEAVRARSPKRVLDVGCGTGSTSVAAARAIGPEGECLGIDISETMVAAARARADREGVPAAFLCADAESYALPAGSFEMIISRFGVMFFDDVERAFENLRRAAAGGAELRFFAWRGPDENPFMTTAETAAAPLVSVPPRQPDVPGQFAFADRERVRLILEESGWSKVEVQPVDIDCTMRESELIDYFTRLGPLARLLPELDEHRRDRVIREVRSAFDRFVQGDEVRFTAACWLATARQCRSSG